MKDKLIYEETYSKPYSPLSEWARPDLKHIPDGFKCIDARMMKAGVIERNGKRLEFQDIRVYLEESDS